MELKLYNSFFEEILYLMASSSTKYLLLCLTVINNPSSVL